MTVPFIEENDQTRARHEHLDALRVLVGNVYPNKFERSNVTKNKSGGDTIASIVKKFKPFEPMTVQGQSPSPEAIETANAVLKKRRVKIAGRIASPPRVMGKVAFVHLSDGPSRLQIFVRMADVKVVDNRTGRLTRVRQAGSQLLKLLDHGDFIGVTGHLFVTRTGELSVYVVKIQFLAKALLPMPHKMHGISDPEIRRRQRYVDLIAESLKVKIEEEEEEEEDDEKVRRADLTTREVFELRSKVVREIRRFLDDRDFVEVETPMLTPLATGAAARPFKTHHNTLHIDLYARIAPELYLKRLVVGGFEKVYELNRNFRNEGISAKHNPEFTMLEFYMAYSDVNQMMDLCEELLRLVVHRSTGKYWIRYGENEINFKEPFHRMSMKEAIVRHWPQKYQVLGGERFEASWLDDAWRLYLLAKFTSDIAVEGIVQLWRHGADAILDLSAHVQETWLKSKQNVDNLIQQQAILPDENVGQRLADVFERIAEPHLIHPTFITDFPKPISPLSKASPSDPSVAERFEYFVGGLESANGFSELNDPEEQYQRFKDQVTQRERGDEEAMVMDEDYIRALSYGMPPAAGIGIGIDRLVMLLANKSSIRDVILFPHLRPEKSEGSRQEAEGSKKEAGH